jgi:hypothetical protein
MPPVIHWPVSQPPMAIVTARNTITSTRPAAGASWASAAARSTAVRAEADTNGDSTGVAEVGQDDPGALGQVGAGQDQPEGGGQDVKRAGNRLRNTEDGHGRVPGLREPGDAQGDAEQVRRNPRAQELVPPWALAFLDDLGCGHCQRHPVLTRGRAGVSMRRRAPRAGRYHRICSR